ncbi:cupin-like domain-containing protein [uncultured Paraglaciecola sp.]|uniref:cupin-like domain-containing protein n=1 Tax=uncultured Paraglaciecola sp. TaxID=1765024 RepID=UPI0030D88FAA|tara:strand:+ start:346838 stop:347857 length:1020 start_codon:yes stop_codon:yes gene_type:complete
MQTKPLNEIACWHNVTPKIFANEILPLHKPAVLKGLVKDWPVVTQAQKSIEHLYQYFSNIYAGGDIQFARIPPAEKGRFFYNQDMSDFNFKREVGPLDKFFRDVLANSLDNNAETLALQSAPVADYFPDFEKQNPFQFFTKKVPPRIWIGNNSVVSAHYDDSENIACVVSGKRIFTLFPPEQIENLYVGPMDFTPAGAPLSLVDFNKPDFEKHPKFQTALDNALVAELEPGDAIYIPSLWWHHVRALGGVNVLVNYWEGGAINGSTKPVPADTILMAMLSIRNLPLEQKKMWKALFDYYIFSDQNQKYEHIPEHVRGILDPLTEQSKKGIKNWLKKQLK